MDKPEIKFLEIPFQRLSVGESDVIVVMYPGVLGPDAAKWLLGSLEAAFPGRKCLVLEETMHIGAMGPGEVSAHC